MNRIFPEAKDYKTVNTRIDDGQRNTIEQKLGSPLLPGQRDQFQYFDMTDAQGKTLGRIFAATQKGEFGAIEFVFGIDTAGVIKGLYIQRSRERDQSFKEKAFLEQFIGVHHKQVSGLETTFKGKKTVGTTAVVRGLIKEIVTFGELTKG